MNDVIFNCPQCGQSLAVAATAAGSTVACPQCGQNIVVPRMAHVPQAPSAGTPPRRRGWLPAVLGVTVVLLIAAVLLFWSRYGRPNPASAVASASIPGLPDNLGRDLVLYFNFDTEPSAGIVADGSGQGNDGHAENVRWIADGHRGGALVFSPTDSHIRVPDNESLNPSNFTLYAWIKTSRTDHYWRRIFDKGLFHSDYDISVAGDWTKWNPPTKYRGFIEFETPKSAETTSRGSIADGRWHQIAATYDGRSNRLFVDGQLQATTHSHDVSLGNHLDLVIGGFTDPDPKHDDPHASFDGSLDDVMIFKRALSSAEIQDLYDSQKTASDVAIDEPAAPPVVPPAPSAAAMTASRFPAQPFPAEVGVNIHFFQGHEHDLDMIAAAGIKVVRIDFQWKTTEPAPGVYDWSVYDALTTNLEKRGLRPYYILDYRSPFYESNGPPAHAAGIAAFSRWAGAAAKHFQGRQIIWEIWNEPNNGGFWKHPNAGQYAALALATSGAIRASDPDATIVAPASIGFPWQYFRTIFNAGILAGVDAVSVHPYRDTPPETVGAQYRRLNELIARYAPRGKYVPIISGEWGYSTYSRGVSPQTQADFVARQQLFNLLYRVPVSIWYDWQDDGQDMNRIGYHRGLVTVDLNPKPSYKAMQILTRELSGYQFCRRYGTDNSADFVLALTNDEGAAKLAAWTAGESHLVTIALERGISTKLPWINGNGDTGTIDANGNSFTCNLSATPEYINLGKEKVRDSAGTAAPSTGRL